MIPDFLRTWSMWILAGALALALGFAGVQTVRLAHTETEFANHKTAVANVNAAREKAHAVDEKLARDTENALMADADTARKEKNDAKKIADARIAALTDSLRNRPERPTPGSGQAATVAKAGEGGTGAGLYRPDAAFLVGDAAAAAQVGAERNECYRLYDAADAALTKYGKAISE